MGRTTSRIGILAFALAIALSIMGGAIQPHVVTADSSYYVNIFNYIHREPWISLSCLHP